MTHQIEFDFTARSTPALVTKMRIAQESGEKDIEDACAKELDRRGEHPDGDAELEPDDD